MGYIKLKKLAHPSSMRKFAMGMWKTAKDPSIYSFMEIDMTKALSKIESYEKKHNIKITPTSLVAKAICHCLKKRPELNALIRNNRIYLREHIDLFFQVNMPGKEGSEIEGADLGGTQIFEAENLKLFEIAKTLKAKATKVKKREDKELSKNQGLIKWIPWSLVGLFLDLSSWIVYGLNIPFPGLPRDPFGSVMITSVGSMGVDKALAPLVPFSRTPAVVVVGEIKKKAWVIDDQVQARPIMTIGVTLDHRVIDGVHGANLGQEFQLCFENPELLFD